MKKNVFIIALLAAFILGCSTETINEDLQQTVVQKSSFSQTIEKLKTSKDFKDYVQSQSVLRKNKDEQGLMILKDDYNILITAIDWETFDLYLIGASQESSGKIEELPNGKARFSVHTKDPVAGVFNLFTGEDFWSSECLDGKLGVFNYNLISEYTVFSPFPGLVFYNPTGEGASALSANGHCKVGNGAPVYDELGELIDCNESTEYAQIRVKTLSEDGQRRAIIELVE